MKTSVDETLASPPPPPPPPTPHQISNRRIKDEKPTDLIEDTRYYYKNLVPDSCDEITFVSVNNHCNPILQSGPTCGLVAIMMAIELIEPNFKLNLSSLLSQAQAMGITKYGEMFYAENVCRFLNETYQIRSSRKFDLEECKVEVLEHICRGLPVLVPYDGDSNYEPVAKNGHTAHWALICGFTIMTTNPIVGYTVVKETMVGHNLRLVQIDQSEVENVINLIAGELSHGGKLFVYARQGKSKHVHIWDFDLLCQSSRNLNRVSEKILNDPVRVKMIYPKNGDLTTSLANQFILIYGIKVY